MSPVDPIHNRDPLVDKAEALAYSPPRSGVWPDRDKPDFRRLIQAYIEARRTDDGAGAARIEAVIRRCVHGGEAAVMAMAVAGLKLEEEK